MPQDHVPALPSDECELGRLDALLEDLLSLHEETALIEHLDRCDACQRMLDSRAAEPETWCDAERFLTDEVYDEFSVSRIDDDSPVDPVSAQIRSVLQVLDPTDHPNSMGRLGPYEVTGVIGSGGMGIVLKGMDPSLDRIVAIKVLAPHLASSGAARQRFGREAKAAAAVLHPNVIAIHSVANDVALPYLVMPYSRGRSLQRRIDQDGPLPTVDVLRIAVQIASGLAAAHSHGLVHRDIKPANILLEEGVERVTITDFGLARAVDDASMTRSGVIAGTPQYMSPEQARGEAIDCRSDLFSLGSALYTMCTGHSPFRAETSFGVLRRITDEEPRPIHETNSSVPRWLCRLIGLLQSKEIEQRFQSADEVEWICRSCLAHLEQPDANSIPEVLRDEPLKRPVRKWLAATVTVALMVVTAIPFLRSGDSLNWPSGGSAAGVRSSDSATPPLQADARAVAETNAAAGAPVDEADATGSASGETVDSSLSTVVSREVEWGDEVAVSLLMLEASLQRIEVVSKPHFLPGPGRDRSIPANSEQNANPPLESR